MQIARSSPRNPALRHVSAARASIDKALNVSADTATRQALDEARVTLSAVLSLNGAWTRTRSSGAAVGSRVGGQIQPQAVLEFLASHPGSDARTSRRLSARTPS